MNKYCFVVCDENEKITSFMVRYYNDLCDIASEYILFTEEDVKSHQGFLNHTTKSLRDKIFKAKSGEVIKVEKTSNIYYSEWIGIRVGDEDDELFDMITYEKDLKASVADLKKQAQQTDLYKEYKEQNKELKEIIELIRKKKMAICNGKK